MRLNGQQIILAIVGLAAFVETNLARSINSIGCIAKFGRLLGSSYV